MQGALNATRGTVRRNAFWSILLAMLLACVVLLTLLGHKALTDWDEGIYAEISREMLTGSWLIPHWNYQLWFEKPPLMFWITATFFKLFGVHEFWARAGSAFSGVAIVGLLHGWLFRRKNALAAWISTVMLLGTFGFLHVCHVGEMDVLLSLGCCIALCGLTAVQECRLNGWYLFWGGFAIAAMTKGSASIVLVLTAVLFAGLDRWDLRHFGKAFWLGFLFFLAAVLPWHLYMFSRFGQDFLGEYLGYHVLARAAHPIEGHLTHWWFYLWVLLVSAPPFVLLYPFAIAAALRRAELRVWAMFALVVVGFFTLVQTRLPHYIAPAYPAFAVLTAVFLADRLEVLLKKSRPAMLWTVVALIAVTISAASILLTSGGRKQLHSARGADGRLAYDEREPAMLLRGVFNRPQSIGGPLLIWWASGSTRSIATSVFYSGRLVQQVQLYSLPPDVPTNRYGFTPEGLNEAITTAPRLILMDKGMVPQIPPEFVYRSIATGRTMEVGIIQRRGD